jgi:hypothetical protein
MDVNARGDNRSALVLRVALCHFEFEFASRQLVRCLRAELAFLAVIQR